MKIEVKQKHIDLAPKLFSKGVNAKECCPISCAIQEKFPDKLVSVGWIGSPDYASKMFHECFYISVTSVKLFPGKLNNLLFFDHRDNQLLNND